MANYNDAELRQIRLIDKLVREELTRQGLPIRDHRPIDDIIACGAFKAAECLVESKFMVDPEWLERARATPET